MEASEAILRKYSALASTVPVVCSKCGWNSRGQAEAPDDGEKHQIAGPFALSRRAMPSRRAAVESSAFHTNSNSCNACGKRRSKVPSRRPVFASITST